MGCAKGNGNGVGFRPREVLFNLLCKRVTGCLPVENSRDRITHSALKIRDGSLSLYLSLFAPTQLIKSNSNALSRACG